MEGVHSQALGSGRWKPNYGTRVFGSAHALRPESFFVGVQEKLPQNVQDDINSALGAPARRRAPRTRKRCALPTPRCRPPS